MSDHITPFATLMTVLLTKKYTFDMPTYGALLGVITIGLNYITSDKFINKISSIEIPSCYFIVFVLIFLYYIYNKNYIYQYYRRYTGKQETKTVYKMIAVNANDDTRMFLNYIFYFPEFYSKPAEVNIGIINYSKTGDSSQAALQSYDRRVANNIEVKFKDTNFNAEGYYVWKNQELIIGSNKNETNIVKCINSAHIYIDEKTCDDPLLYFRNMEKIVNQKEENKPTITCWFIKYSSLKQTKEEKRFIANDYYETYSGEKKTIEELKPIYIDTFFSPEKETIWTIVKQIHMDPMAFFTMGQSPQAGFILYGPPGNGKSSFPYRLAMTLERHLLSIDIRVIKKRNALYQIMRKPWINDDMYTTPKRVIYIFDEFDITVNELYAKEKRKKKVTE